VAALLLTGLITPLTSALTAQQTAKPVLHGSHWVAITGKPLGATAGAMMFHKGGNAVDAAAAMLAATATMWDVLSWGGETQALIYNPNTSEVIGLNALGVAPTGATPEFYLEEGYDYPPQYGPLAAVTPGTPASPTSSNLRSRWRRGTRSRPMRYVGSGAIWRRSDSGLRRWACI
jgi:gamma-glutamyltranspeptidase/glutathione hydrolase